MGDPSRVGEARRHAAQLAAECGLDEVDTGRLALVVTELGTNLVRHARHGRLWLSARPARREVEVLAVDDGPGIADIERSLGDGSVWDIVFSKDPQQKYLFLADGKNEKIYVILRETLEILTSFGDGGRQPGQFFAVHSIASDSKGNLYTTETYEGKRIQKFVYKGLANVTKVDQGTPWPESK